MIKTRQTTTEHLLINNMVNFTERKTFLPVKLILVLAGSALAISFLAVVALYYYPLITTVSLLLGLLLFVLLVKPKKHFVLHEEYAPDYSIGDSDPKVK